MHVLISPAIYEDAQVVERLTFAVPLLATRIKAQLQDFLFFNPCIIAAPELQLLIVYFCLGGIIKEKS